MQDHHLRNDCRLCGSKSVTKALSLTPTPPANNFVRKEDLDKPQTCYPLDLYFCQDCTHVQLCDVVDPKILFEHYVYVSGTSPAYRKHLENYAQDVISFYIKNKDAEVLEIGSNDGTFLKFFQDAGYKVHGVDPAKNIAEIANQDGIPTTADFFGQSLAKTLVQKGHKPDIILANHVFAHIDDLRGVMEGVSTLLSDDGHYIFEVSYLADVIEKGLFDTIYHEHVAYHSVKALQNFMGLYGFELVDVQLVDHQGGSLRGFAARKGVTKTISPRINLFLEREEQLGLDKLETYHAYSRHLQALKNELTNLLRLYKEEGKTIAAFGAPAKATTLMYHFGLDTNVIDFIADDNPLKQDMFTPGLHVPVLPAKEIYSRKPDVVVILAWNFADSIIGMHQAYIEQGGVFVIPLPDLRLVEKQAEKSAATT